MAEFGANYPCFCANGKDDGIVIGKLVSANLTVNLASGELYADDSLAEQASEFASGSIAMETDDLVDESASEIYGCKVVEKEVVYNKDDTPPMGCLAYYKVLMRNGKKFFKAFFYPKARAALGNDNAQTKGSSITFQTTNTTFTIFADDAGDWRKTKTFDDVKEAIAYIKEKCKINPLKGPDGVKVPDQQAQTGIGTKKVSDLIGEDFALTVSGTTVKATGNVKNIQDPWTEFDKKDNTGHFVPFILPVACKGKDITIEGRNTSNRTVKADDSLMLIQRLENLSGDITSIKMDDKLLMTVDFSGVQKEGS